MKQLIYIICCSFIMLSCKKNRPGSCNGDSTRRSIKILTDDDVNEIDTANIIYSNNIDSIGSFSVPNVNKNSPRQDIEKRVFTIRAKVHKLSKHRDGDYKVKLTDGNDKFINCESPNMGCEHIDGSPYHNQMTEVRDWIENEKDDLEGKTVTITGVVFIDKDHKYPRNAADNEVELHPILNIHY